MFVTKGPRTAVPTLVTPLPVAAGAVEYLATESARRDDTGASRSVCRVSTYPRVCYSRSGALRPLGEVPTRHRGMAESVKPGILAAVARVKSRIRSLSGTLPSGIEEQRQPDTGSVAREKDVPSRQNQVELLRPALEKFAKLDEELIEYIAQVEQVRSKNESQLCDALEEIKKLVAMNQDMKMKLEAKEAEINELGGRVKIELHSTISSDRVQSFMGELEVMRVELNTRHETRATSNDPQGTSKKEKKITSLNERIACLEVANAKEKAKLRETLFEQALLDREMAKLQTDLLADERRYECSKQIMEDLKNK